MYVAVLVKIWKYSTTGTCYDLTGVASIDMIFQNIIFFIIGHNV